MARVGDNHAVTAKEVEEYADNNLYLVLGFDPAVGFEKALEEVVVAQQKRLDFFASGLHRDDEVLRPIQRRITEELVLEYFQTQYEEKYINEEAIREAHEQVGRRVVYRQVVVPKPPGASPEALEALEATISEIRDRLGEGEDFEAVAGEVAESLPLALSGYGEPVTWRRSLSSAPDYVIFNMDVEGVRAIEGKSSYAVVQVERVERVPVETSSEARDEIDAALRARFMPTAVEEFEREKLEAVDSSSVRWNQEGLEQVVEWSRTPGFYEQDYRETLQQAVSDDRNFVIMTYAGGEVDVEELLHLLNDVLIIPRSGSYGADEIKGFILEAVRTDAIAERARDLGLYEALMTPETESTVLRNLFVRLYDRRMIEERIPEASPEALRAFYEAHRDSLFYQIATASLYVVVASDEGEADALWSGVERGVPFEELAGGYAVKSFVRTRAGEVEAYRSSETPYLGEVAFDLEEGEVRGPIEFEHPEEGVRYAVVKGGKQEEERPLRYEEAEERVAAAFEEHHRARLEAAIEESLREEYPVTIYRDVIEEHLANE